MLLKSLDDKIAIKRAAAGEALVLARVKDEYPNVKKLLKDADVNVRFRVCMAMMPLQDRDVVPVMIDLLNDLTPNQLWPIEEALALGRRQASRRVVGQRRFGTQALPR